MSLGKITERKCSLRITRGKYKKSSLHNFPRISLTKFLRVAILVIPIGILRYIHAYGIQIRTQ